MVPFPPLASTSSVKTLQVLVMELLQSSGPLVDSPFITCTATPPKHLLCHIRLRKFIKFDKLLPVHEDSVFGRRERLGTGTKRQRHTRRQVHDLASWLEAWNILLVVPPQRGHLGVVCNQAALSVPQIPTRPHRYRNYRSLLYSKRQKYPHLHRAGELPKVQL